MLFSRRAICDPSLIEVARRIGMLFGAALGIAALVPCTALGASSTLSAGATLSPGQSIVSPDGHYELAMQSDGNLVEYIVNGRALWSTKTNGDEGTRAVMQRNGNLVLYDPSGGAVWSSNSRTTGCPRLVIQNDGNIVIYATKAIWASGTVQTMMARGDVLHPGWSIYSPPPEDFHLIMQGDGNLVLYDGTGHAMWASGTDHHPGADAVMQGDGNLVVYDETGRPLWASATNRHPGAYLALQTDGNLVVYLGTKPLWASGTNGKGAHVSQAPKVPAPVACPPPPPPPSPPVVTVPVSTPIPTPQAPRHLKVKLRISWTWNHATTWLQKVRIGHFPGKTQLTFQCRGHGCPRHQKATAAGVRRLRRLLHSLRGRRYRAGDRLLITLTAPRYLPERAEVFIRNGRLPSARLLRR